MHDAEDTGLADDLLEDSERIFHRGVAEFQQRQMQNFHESLKEAVVWGNHEIEGGANPENTQFIIETHAQKLRSALREERDTYVRNMRIVQKIRNQNLLLFLLDHERKSA